MGESGQRGRLFGTDGVRGVAGYELTAALALDLSVAAAAILGTDGADAGTTGAGTTGAGRPPVAVVGRDPRASGEFLEAAVVAGLASSGVDVLRLGVIPTPGVAYLTKALGAAFGVVISASHNPARDNGIKFFGPGGVKLPDAVEDQIEDRLGSAPPTTASFGRVSDAGATQELYLDHLLSTLPADPAKALAGLRIVADCAHGAAYRLAPQALTRAGADVIAIGHEPDGLNINAGYGSTCLDTLAAAVVEHGADAGVAYDGDADRCLAVDADGQPLDGDQILAVLATELAETGRLAGDAVVVTVMSNQGFHVAMRDAGIGVIETPVGDKHVSAAMRAGGYVLGGEQSGHIILLEHATTGDGILTSLQLLAAVQRHGMPLAAAAKMMRKYPQVLVNVPGDASRLGPEVAEAVTRAEETLGDNGRVLVRPSGTEPAIRLMVQAADAVLAEQVIGQLAAEVRLALAGQ
ncbi:MAG TPA: phosphoglucosamine mutase [Streptosporangiaceae bacterium]|nr:phosphoglucosamine mutase [Streptosporangiaceae bacterium]